MLRGQRWTDRALLLVVLGAALLTVLWDIAVERPAHPALSKVLGDLSPAITNTHAFPNQFVGVFGWLDTPLPHFAYGVTELIYIMMMIGALALGSQRDACASPRLP